MPYSFMSLALISALNLGISPSLAEPTFKASSVQLLSQNSSALSQLQLAFKDYTWKDGTFSFSIPGQCPVERPGASCGYPNTNSL